MMSKVWTVYLPCYEDWTLVKVCTTEEIAKAWKARLNSTVSEEERMGFDYKVGVMDLTENFPNE